MVSKEHFGFEAGRRSKYGAGKYTFKLTGGAPAAAIVEWIEEVEFKLSGANASTQPRRSSSTSSSNVVSPATPNPIIIESESVYTDPYDEEEKEHHSTSSTDYENSHSVLASSAYEVPVIQTQVNSLGQTSGSGYEQPVRIGSMTTLGEQPRHDVVTTMSSADRKYEDLDGLQQLYAASGVGIAHNGPGGGGDDQRYATPKPQTVNNVTCEEGYATIEMPPRPPRRSTESNASASQPMYTTLQQQSGAQSQSRYDRLSSASRYRNSGSDDDDIAYTKIDETKTSALNGALNSVDRLQTNPLTQATRQTRHDVPDQAKVDDLRMKNLYVNVDEKGNRVAAPLNDLEELMIEVDNEASKKK